MASNKRGVSPVVAEVLLVMLTLAAIGIVVAFVLPFIKENLNKSTECLNYKDYFKFQEVFKLGAESYKYNCKNNTNHLYGISIKAGSDKSLAESIIGFNVVFVGITSSKAVRIDGGASVDGVNMISGTGPLEIPNAGEVRTYVYSSLEGFKKMEVYPVLKSGRICEMSDSIDIVPCGANVVLK
jgi:hypothetical protein